MYMVLPDILACQIALKALGVFIFRILSSSMSILSVFLCTDKYGTFWHRNCVHHGN